MVGGGLALSLDKNGNVGPVLAIPSSEGLQDLKTVGSRRNGDIDGGAILRRGLVGVVSRIVATAGKTFASRGLQKELVAVLVLELVCQGVEVKAAGNRESNDQIRRGDEGVGSRVSIVATGEVTVVR